MSFPVPVCEACRAAAFPPRLLCPECGSREWRVERVDIGVVERATERDGTSMATVRIPLGPVLVARLTGPAGAGDHVRLDTEGDVPVATP